MRYWKHNLSVVGLLLGAGCTSGPSGGSEQAARLLLEAAPISAQAGVVFNVPPAVQVVSLDGSPVAQRGIQVSVVIASGGGTLGGLAAVRTDAEGRAVFPDLSISGSTGPRMLRFSASGMSPALSGTIDLQAGPATQMVPFAGNNITAAAGTDVVSLPTVKVTDAFGNPVAGVVVDFAVTSGGGSLEGASATTGADGLAAVTRWTLGNTPGLNTLSATAPGGLSVTFNATAVSGPPAQLVVLEGANQTAIAGRLLTTAIRVKVTDQAGNASPGVRVTFAIIEGGGLLVGATPVTGSDGVAQLGGWLLGPEPGPNAVTATVFGLAPLTITATGEPVPVVVVAGNNQRAFAGDQLLQPIRVLVLDGAGLPRVGVSVTFEATSGGGSFVGSTGVTDNGGFAQAQWVLGPGDGIQTARITADQAGPGTATATAVTFRSITVAWRSACGVTPGGVAYCWGSNGFQQLGDNTAAGFRLNPVPVTGGILFEALEGAGGGSFYCGVTAAQAAYCWGSNRHGQPGDGITPISSGSTIGTPVLVAGNLTWQLVRPGGDFACGLTTAGEAWCWGANNRAQLGDLVSPERNFPGPVAPGLTFKDLAAGITHVCGLTPAGDVYCWGSRDGFTSQGILGVPDATLIPGGIKFESITAGASTCGLTSDGTAYCWGANASGQLGNGTTTGNSTPQPVSGGLKFIKLSARGNTTCGLTGAGTAYCWGANDTGQAGTGSTGSLTTPALVTGSLTFTTITASLATTCGLVDDGIPWCWGPNDSGQVGDGTRLQRVAPTRTRF